MNLKQKLEVMGISPRYRVSLERLQLLPDGRVAADGGPRTTGIEGYAPTLPTVGMPMAVFGRPLTNLDADFRMWRTSPVAEVIQTPGSQPDQVEIRFKTANSDYRLTVFADASLSE